MIIDHANRLHIRIDDRRSDEGHPSFFEIFWDFFWYIWLCREVRESESVADYCFLIQEIPEIIIQTPELIDDLECCDRIFANWVDL